MTLLAYTKIAEEKAEDRRRYLTRVLDSLMSPQLTSFVQHCAEFHKKTTGKGHILIYSTLSPLRFSF